MSASHDLDVVCDMLVQEVMRLVADGKYDAAGACLRALAVLDRSRASICAASHFGDHVAWIGI